jgi:CRISPR/Cas system-associated endoribonuclease Cas2
MEYVKMKPFTISYDLDTPGRDYQRLFARLLEHGAFRVQLSQWALATTWTAVQLRDDLMKYIDSNDRLLVVQIAD